MTINEIMEEKKVYDCDIKNGRWLWCAKRADNGDWVIGTPYRNYMICGMNTVRSDDEIPQSEYPEFDYVEILPETLGQLAGLTNVNRLVFEGDIVSFEFGEGDVSYTVEWDTENLQFVLRSREDNSVHQFKEFFVKEIEVIDNIHDIKIRASEGD